MEQELLDDGLFRSVAANGLTVLSEKLAGVRSAAVGIWVRSASAHETPEKMGVAHLLEHLVFKGTVRRTATAFASPLNPPPAASECCHPHRTTAGEPCFEQTSHDEKS